MGSINMKKKEKNITLQEAPKKEENSGLNFDSIKLLGRIDDVENKINLLEKALDFIKGTNWFILIVLFVGFLALLFSLISASIQAFHTNTATQVELIRSVDHLNSAVEEIKLSVDETNR